MATTDARIPDRVRDSLRPSADFLSPVNAVVFAVITVLDIATPAMEKGASRLIALVAALMIAVVLYRINSARLAAQSAGAPSAWQVFLAGRGNKLSLALIPFAIGMAWIGAAHAYPRGAVAGLVPGGSAIQNAIFGIQKDVGEIKADVYGMKSDVSSISKSLNPTDARGRLKGLQYGLDDESKARAIETCDLDALNLFVDAKEAFPEAVPVFGTRGGSVLEKPIAAANPRLSEVLRLLAKQGMKFDNAYPLTFTQAQSAAIPEFQGLVKQVPAPLRLGFMPALVRANPLTVAIWFGNAEAARELVRLGADVNSAVEASLPILRGGQITGGPSPQPVSTAAREAKRLHREALLAAGK